MKTSPLKKILILLSLLIASNQAKAWSGYDYDNKSAIDIGEGNIVREGLVIQFYDNQDDNFHTAKVLFLESIAGGTQLQVQDLDQKKERTFIMDN
jgi:hypothetical protein